MITKKRSVLITALSMLMLLFGKYEAFPQSAQNTSSAVELKSEGKPLSQAELNLQNFKPDSPDQKLNVLRQNRLQLIVKMENAIAENSTDAAGIAELQSRLANLDSQIATREVEEKETIALERRYISRLTGYSYQNGKTISESLSAYVPVSNNELNALQIELLTKQARVETGFRTLSEDEKAALSIEIKNLLTQINKLNDKLSSQ